MNKEVLIKAGIDVDNAMKRFFNNMEFYERMLGKFLEDKSFSEAKTLYENKEYDKLFSPLHTLKGISGNLDFTVLYKSTCELVEELRVNKYDNVEPLFSIIEKNYELVVEAISEATK